MIKTGLGLGFRVLGFRFKVYPKDRTVMGNTSPNHNSNSKYRNPTFYYIGTLDLLGVIDGVWV